MNSATHNLFSKSNQSLDEYTFDILYMLDEYTFDILYMLDEIKKICL
jgi:hypothetical protein